MSPQQTLAFQKTVATMLDRAPPAALGALTRKGVAITQAGGSEVPTLVLRA